MRSLLTQHAAPLIRFAAVGLGCFALSLSILSGLHELAGVHYLVAYFVAFVVTSCVGYLLNARFTFQADKTNSVGALRYTMTNVGLVILNGAALRMLVEYFHLWYLGASVLLAAINTPVSFIAHRLITYRKAQRAAMAVSHVDA